MEADSIESIRDKIRHQEEENEIKLKEKRALESSLAGTTRRLRDTISHTSKLNDEYEESVKRKDALEIEVTKAQARRQALSEQLQASNEELQQLKAKSNDGVLKVWNSRNSMCNEIQTVADQCDVWALFSKPTFVEIPGPSKKQLTKNVEEPCEEEETLKEALKKRELLLKERERLLNEPDSGDDFVRIRNAIRYSEEMTAKARM